MEVEAEDAEGGVIRGPDPARMSFFQGIFNKIALAVVSK